MTREEAIKILKARPYSGEVLEALETLVPEYNESEDEKVRKALLDYFSCTGDDNLMLNGVYIKDIIAYLDKMKEEEGYEEIPVESTLEYRIGKKDGFNEGLEQGKKQFYWKPTEEDIRLFNKAVTTNTSLSPQERAKLDIVKMKFKHCPYIKQKSEWSEDDEKTLDYIILVLDKLGFEKYCKSSRDQDVEEERFYYKEIQVLKKLKSLCPQPKQEWTKEDEIILSKIIKDYETVDKTVRHNSMLFGKTKSKLEWLQLLLEKVKKGQPPIENEKASEENILDKPNNVNDIKFPFKAKIKANNKTVIISFGRLNKDRNQWIMYTSDYTNNFKEYMPKELELIKDE